LERRPITVAPRSAADMKLLVLVALVFLVAAPPAAAQEDGVFVDPESPAGKEYAVPIDQARGEAAGGGNRSAGEEPLFGEGIERAGASPGNEESGEGARRKGQAASKRGQQSSEQQGDAGDGEPSPSSSDLGRSSAAIEAAAAEGSDGLLTAGIAAAVLAAGLLAGFGLRRLLRNS
jgi:hypothetical protein